MHGYQIMDIEGYERSDIGAWKFVRISILVWILVSMNSWTFSFMDIYGCMEIRAWICLRLVFI